MSHKAFRASFTIAPLRYIGPGDTAPGGDLPLGQGWLGVEPVAQGDHHGLPLVQALGHAPAHLGTGIPGIQLLQHVVIHADGIQKGQGVPIPVPVDGVGQGHLTLELPLGAEVHQDFILNAPGGVSSQADILVRLEGADALDQADGADGNQVVLVAVGGVVLLHDVGHQAQVVLNEDVAGLQIPLGHALQVHPLLLRLQGAGEGAGDPAGEPQGEKQAVEGQENPSWEHNVTPPLPLYSRRVCPYAPPGARCRRPRPRNCQIILRFVSEECKPTVA